MIVCDTHAAAPRSALSAVNMMMDVLNGEHDVGNMTCAALKPLGEVCPH